MKQIEYDGPDVPAEFCGYLFAYKPPLMGTHQAGIFRGQGWLYQNAKDSNVFTELNNVPPEYLFYEFLCLKTLGAATEWVDRCKCNMYLIKRGFEKEGDNTVAITACIKTLSVIPVYRSVDYWYNRELYQCCTPSGPVNYER